MSFVLHPWQVVFAALSGWVNQQQIIEFQNAENAVARSDPVWISHARRPRMSLGNAFKNKLPRGMSAVSFY